MDTLHAFLCLSIIMVVVHTGVGLTIDRINRACMKMEECVYEQHRAYICLRRWHRFFPCYSKQEPHLIDKKVFVLQSVWYGLILFTLIFLLASLFLEGWPRLILCAMAFFLDAGFMVYTGTLFSRAREAANIRFKLDKTNEK